MNKVIATIVAVVALVAMPQIGHAQTTSSKSKNTTTSGADAAAVMIVQPGAFAGPAGLAAGAAASAVSQGFQQPQMIMNSTNAPSTGTFNDCGIAWSGALWLISASSTSESKSCVAQRQALLALSMGRPDLASERMCDNEEWRLANERTHGPQCAASVEARRVADEKAARNRPVQPVVAAVQPVSTGVMPGCTVHSKPDGSGTFQVCN